MKDIQPNRVLKSGVFFALASVLIWSSLAYLGSRLSHVSSSLVTGLALCIGGLIGLIRLPDWKAPWRVLAVGTGGMFGYHFLLFSAFQIAPVVEANLINYLWPLLIVLLTPLVFPHNRLRWYHLLGGLLAFCGTALIISGGSLRPDSRFLAGYLMAAAAALTWALYSLLTKRLGPFKTGAVGAFCLLGGLFSLGVELLRGGLWDGLAALRGADTLFLLLTGLGPLGLAFYAWDAALKHGDPRTIGSLAYFTPLLSTLVLVVLGGKALTWVSVAAMLLIISGAVLGSWESLKPR